MLMQKDVDYFIQGIHVDNNKELVVVSDFLSYSKDWPTTIDYKGKKYTFNGKSPLPECYVGHYFSMALYLEKEAVAVNFTDTVYGKH